MTTQCSIADIFPAKSLKRIQLESWAKAHLTEFFLEEHEKEELIDFWLSEIVPVKFPVETQQDVNMWADWLRQFAESEIELKRIRLRLKYPEEFDF
jgi:hypothetical protein